MKIETPNNVKYILSTLIDHGYEAYAVGGCVRDSILLREPGDWDITTSAKPVEVKALFKRTLDTGIKHGTVTVMMDKEGYEVTTYRIDGEYEDSRHPKEVEFTTSLYEDLKRRDFTINAMAYNEKEGLVDKFDGLLDIERRCIRCVGNASDRFEEDALRILRAVRFSAQLGFYIDDKTKEAIREKVCNLKNISAERIRVELDKLLVSKSPKQLMVAYETGITKVILPEFDLMLETEQNNPYHLYDVGEHSLIAVELVDADSILRWTMLLHDVGKPATRTTDEKGIDHFYGHTDKSVTIAKNILKRLKFDNYTIDTVTRLIKWHDYNFSLTSAGMRKAINKIGEDILELLFTIKKADIMAKNKYKNEQNLNELNQAIVLYKEIKKNKECVNLKDLKVNGKDMIELGYRPGKSIGEVLEYLLQTVLEDPTKNERHFLLQLAKKYMESLI